MRKVFTATFLFVFLFVKLVPISISARDYIAVLIYAFALYEAWKMNRRVPIQVNGPYDVALGAAGADGQGGAAAAIAPSLTEQGGAGRE